MTSASKRLFIITGDYSGDAHAAKVVRALRSLQPDMEISAVGGQSLKAEGVALLEDQSQMGRIGLGSIWGAPYHYFLGKRILKHLERFNPDAVLLIDYGVFNLWMAQQLRARGIKVFYFIPPQVWASRKGRIRKIQAGVDHVFCIFPFEEELYRSHDVPVTYVGHPLVGELPPADKAAFCREHGLDPEKPVIGIFPGSRKMEIDYLLKPVLSTVPLIRKTHRDAQIILAKAGSLKADYFRERYDEAAENLDMGSKVSITVVDSDNHGLMGAADALIAKSGTTTLEAALYGVPMIIIYRGNPIVAQIAMRMCELPCIGLPNILTDMQNPIIRELWQSHVNPKEMAETLLPLLDKKSEAYRRQMDGFADIRKKLKGDAPMNVARGILEQLGVQLPAATGLGV